MAKLNAANGLDGSVLLVLSQHGQSATYVIKNWLKGQYQYGLRTAHVLRACKSLADAGLVEEVPTSYMVMKTWRITPAGRAALEPPHE